MPEQILKLWPDTAAAPSVPAGSCTPRVYAHGLSELLLRLRNPGSVQVEGVVLTLMTLCFKRKTKFPETSAGSFYFDSGSQLKVAESRLGLLALRSTQRCSSCLRGLGSPCSPIRSEVRFL